MIVNRSAPPGPIVPVLSYNDVAKAIEWLCGAFGFKERLRTPLEADGTIHHTQLAVGEGSVILHGVPVADRRPRDPNAFVDGPMVYVEDVDAHFERAKKFGAKIVNPPATCPFGERQYSVLDLAGYRWAFSQSVADVDPVDWGAQVADIQSSVAPLRRPRVCYLEIPAVDVHQSALFYEKVFGCNIRNRDSARPSFDFVRGNVSGAFVTARPICREPGLLPYIWVDGIDDVLARAASQGGEIVDAVHPDHPGGTCWIATFRDPAGNLIGLYQEAAR
jgi:predicted enzyme related to lactoylglutathione lyase